jgi:hypothetical protein
MGYFLLMWHIYPLLGSDRKTNNKTMAVGRQRPMHNNGSTVGSSVFFVVVPSAI